MPCRIHFRTRVREQRLRAVRCKARPNHLFNPTLDRSVVSLPLHSFAVKRGLTERYVAQSMSKARCMRNTFWFFLTLFTR